MAIPLTIAEIACRSLDFPVTPATPPIHPSRVFLRPVRCTPVQQQIDLGIQCEPCGGRGWLLCDFCKGQKTNVQSETNKKIYRRCPSCRAIGYLLCWKCKVFKCVTYPNADDGQELQPSM
ncbi:uncharacterized protein LOC116031913 [Ipomoea triloba]|uniref:uncharacterized protein LOC116031913 n=1 Tax=Ipomoea triloba TaxID=35885 RepID=UPI00125D03F7|nr:uncharacterized protein LOC116031913 [Ipomoea triloba]